ncbi:hypothetical protein PSAR109036_04095 [Psychrobacter arenosus]|uniref:hypothetical protein n=1 Tax=Psychrobacter arenosus TaxID=256326 RepID=UPI001919E70B|nr:hypothetical protein [Psychrobacter arenosus]
MTANTSNQTPLSATGNTDADTAKDIVFYDGMSEEELDLLLQASLTEDIDKASAKSTTDLAQTAAAESSKSPVISTAVTNAQAPRPNKPTKYYSALSPSVADRTVFRSDSHKVETAKERAAMATAEKPKPAGSQLVIDDTVVEAPEEFKDLTLASAETKASQAAPVPQQPAPTPRKSLKALTAAHSTSVRIRPKVAPTPVTAQILTTKAPVTKQEAVQTKTVERPITETPQVDSTPASTTATATDTAIPKAVPKKVSAIKIKPKAAVSQPKTIAAESDSEVIVAQAPPVTPVAPIVVAEQSQTAEQPNAVDQSQSEEQPQPAPVTSNTEELPTANVDTDSTVDPIVANPVLSEPMQPEFVQAEPVVTELAPAVPAPLASDTTTMDKAVIEETVIEQAIMTMPASESSLEQKTEQQTGQQVSPVAIPDMDTQTLSEQVSADMHSFKTQLHHLTLQFHELSTLSSRLVQQLRHLQSNSTEDFSVTYEQMLELRSHLVDTKKQASDLPSLLDVAEEALESDMYVAQTRKKR